MFKKKNKTVYNSFYSILGTDICLESPVEEINEQCNFLLKEFVCEKLPESYSVIRVEEDFIMENCYSIYKNGKMASNFGEELSTVQYSVLPQVLENIISGHALNQVNKQELITLHSGALSKNGKGILILGESGNGKSTLTLEMVANHGWGYLSDEVGLIDINYCLQPFQKTVAFIPGVVNLGPEWALKKYGLKYQTAIPKNKYGEPTPLKSVFFIKYSKDKKPEFRILTKSESLIRLTNSQIGRARFSASLERMAEVVKKVNSYEIIHNNCARAAELIEETMVNGNG